MKFLSMQFNLPFGKKCLKLYTYIEIVLAVIATALFLAFAGAQSMWVDELYWSWDKVIYGSFVDISKQLVFDGYNMPLYYWLIAPWFRVAPWGEFWLLLPSIAFTLAGFFAVKLAATEIAGRDAGFIAFCYAVSSTCVFRDTAFGVRPYSLYFLMTALTLYFFVRRLKEENTKNIVLYGILMALLCYTHWFGGLLVVFYALTDLALCTAKKVRFRCIVSYVIAGILVLPWLVLVLLYRQIDVTSYWGAVPGNIAIEVVKTINFIMGNPIAGLILIYSGLIVVGIFAYNARKHAKGFDILFYCALCCVWLIGVPYCYSRFINTNGSVFVFRYFIAIIPHAFLIASVGTIAVYNVVSRRFFKLKTAATILLVLVLAVNGVWNWYKQLSFEKLIFQPMREVAELLKDDKDAYSEKSLVVGDAIYKAWTDYYFERRGFNVPPNIVNQENISGADLLIYDKIYVCQFHNSIDEGFLSFIEANYSLESTYYHFNGSNINKNGLGVYVRR